MLRVVFISGISGSGKSVALRTLEDAGYNCVDNLPVRFLHDFIATAHDDGLQRVGVSIDARSSGDIARLPAIITSLRALGTEIRVVFLDADTGTLVQRYSESRRRHPLSQKLFNAGVSPSLETCIAAERDLLGPLRELGNVIDTTGLTPGQLRAWVRNVIQADSVPLILTFESFAFKEGVPLDADLMFDVRCLPNPHYDPVLRPLTGRDAAVAGFLEAIPSVGRMIDDIAGFVRTWLPQYMQDTRSYMTVAIGCTGGRHRSVYVVERLAAMFADQGQVLVRHRAQKHFDLYEPEHHGGPQPHGN
ncbi:RNase adapter RapZ [Pigmentiphaga soli]|uniref:RNase adapter RapZ n=1 Tax=Pigmentiphaga soli TaxID=1007095 RepID=A0ABP8HD55_9BURK